MVLSSTSSPSVYGLSGSNAGLPAHDRIVLSYPVYASSSISKGDLVKLQSSTAASYVVKCSATSDAVLGVALETVDNASTTLSTTASGARFVSVLRRGFTYLDAAVTGSSTYDEPICQESVLYLAGSVSAAGQAGQLLTGTTDTGVGTAKVAVAFDTIATPSTATDVTIAPIRVYWDTLDRKIYG